jgi:hypothetical protein
MDKDVQYVDRLQEKMVVYVGAHKKPTLKGMRRVLPKGVLVNYAIFDALNNNKIVLTPSRFLKLPDA